MKITVLLGMDMETDVGSWTPFYEGLANGTPLLLDLLTARSVPATFFFVADGAREHPAVLRDVARAGFEVGCHTLYHETVGDEIFPIPGLKPLLPEEIHHRLDVATRILEDLLGEKVRSFRAPRLWGSTAMVNALEDLGYAADASYPMFFHKDRLLPYHPSREDWTQEGDLRLVEIPNFANMSMESADPYGRDRDQWPLFRTEGCDALMVHVEGFLDHVAQRADEACLCFYFHPWEFWPMPQGEICFGEGAVRPDPFIVKNTGDVALRELGLLIDRLQALDAEFLTAAEIAARY